MAGHHQCGVASASMTNLRRLGARRVPSHSSAMSERSQTARCAVPASVRMPCRFGGAWPYFVCPGVVNGTACGRRVAKLYGPGRYFVCRHCYRLSHASQSEDAQRRSMRRASKIRQRLGGNAGRASPFPPKPKGMWRRTYERLREQALDAEERADEALLPYVARLMARTNNRKRNRRKGKGAFGNERDQVHAAGQDRRH
jgi:hypothetical protein